jgi:hypothetical protein
MLDFADDRWLQLHGGYRAPFDVRPLLSQLESGRDRESVLQALWQELYHQGDVGEASYAAVPHLVRIYCSEETPDWNFYAIVATVDLARDGRYSGNPPLPSWLEPDYVEAIDRLASRGLKELPGASSPELVQSILAVLALWKGSRSYARILAEFTESEVDELEQQAFGTPDN